MPCSPGENAMSVVRLPEWGMRRVARPPEAPPPPQSARAREDLGRSASSGHREPMEFPALHHIYDAIRTEVGNDLGPFDSDHVLTVDAGCTLFDARLLAPREIVADRALDYIRIDPDARDLMPVELVEMYRECVIKEGKEIAREPLDYPLTPQLRSFYGSLTRTFGVEDEHAETLLLALLESPEADRLGVFLAIERSPGFEWLTPLIDVAPKPKKITEPLTALGNVNRRMMGRVAAGDVIAKESRWASNPLPTTRRR